VRQAPVAGTLAFNLQACPAEIVLRDIRPLSSPDPSAEWFARHRLLFIFEEDRATI
jgi:hypothetical protein